MYGRVGRNFQDLTRDHKLIQRVTIASSLADVLGPTGDSNIPLLLPEDLIFFANNLITEALIEKALPYDVPSLKLVLSDEDPPHPFLPQLRAVYWYIDSVRA